MSQPRRSLRLVGLILVVGTVVLRPVVAAARAQERLPAVTTQTVRFAASSLAGEQTFSILLPSTYHQTQVRFPVVYLLHGLPQDHTAFSNRPWFAEQAAKGIIIVTPNARDSWYVNSAASPEERYEDFLIRDLVPYVDTHYRTIASRQGRAIAGISMGGWGAALLGLKHHRLFGAVGIFSAPFAISRLSMPESEMSEKTQQRFGPPNSAARRQRDPNTLSLETPVGLLPRLVIACGGEDDFVRQSRLFAERLRGRAARYEYHELVGLGHSFDVWDQEIPAFIASVVEESRQRP